MSGRRAARRTALELLYQWDLTGQPLASLHEGDVDEFALELAEGVAGQAPELDERISEASDEWRADRLGVVERNVVRMGLFELDRATCRWRWRSTRPSRWPSATRARTRAAS